MTHICLHLNSLSYPQKQEIVIQFYDLSDTVASAKVETPEPITLPFSPTKQHFNSLNILAEASRRVGANDPPKDGVYTTLEGHHGSHLPLDPSLDIDSFTQTYLNDEDILTTNTNGMGQLLP